MKRSGWVLAVVLGCGQSANPLPVEEPKPLAESKPAPRDAAVVIDAAPVDAVAVVAAPDPAALHKQCVDRRRDPLPAPTPAPKGKPQPTIALVEVGGVDEKQNPNALFAEGPWNGTPILRKLQSKVGPLRTCYADALTRDPSLHGGVTLAATLNEDGTLTEPRVFADAIGDAALATCLSAKLGKVRVPGGSKDAFNFEAYFDIVLCPSSRKACLLGVQAPDDIRDKVMSEARTNEAMIEACFVNAVKKPVRGRVDQILTFSDIGAVQGGRHDVKPFVGDDKSGTAESAASDCIHDVWTHVCLDPPSAQQIRVEMWFQR